MCDPLPNTPLPRHAPLQKFFGVGFGAFESYCLDAQLSSITSFLSSFLLTLLVSIAVLVACGVCLYEPSLQALDADIKMVRSLLLLFPDDIAGRIPAIIAAARELLLER